MTGTALLGLVALAVVAFGFAATQFYASRQAPQLAVALGLASLALALGVAFTLTPPPEPGPTPPPTTTDFGGYRPHFQGFGATTRGGRGGPVCVVDNLDPARLAACVAPRPGCVDTWQTCARTVVFSVSGTSTAGAGYIAVTSPYLTIAGQTAPAGGYTLAGARFLIDTHDVVVQHLKIRRPPISLNACSIGDAGDGGDNSHVQRVIFDHVTCTWSTDVNNFLQAGPGSSNILLADVLVAEGLWTGALGGIGAGIGGDVTVIRSLFSNHWSRQPIWGSPARVTLINSVSYNGTDNTHGSDTLPAFWGDADGEGNAPGLEQTVLVNNVALPGPNSGQAPAILGLSKKQGSLEAGVQIYLAGNTGPGITADQWTATVCTGSYGTYPNAATCGASANVRTNSPFSWWVAFAIAPLPASAVLDTVLAGVGARPLDRDAADRRMIADVQARTGTHYLDWAGIDARGGMPTIPPVTRPVTLPANPNDAGTCGSAEGSPRTRLECFLESDPTFGARRLEPPR